MLPPSVAFPFLFTYITAMYVFFLHLLSSSKKNFDKQDQPIKFPYVLFSWFIIATGTSVNITRYLAMPSVRSFLSLENTVLRVMWYWVHI